MPIGRRGSGSAGGSRRTAPWSSGSGGARRSGSALASAQRENLDPETGAEAEASDEGQSLRIADDEAGTSWWMTGEEAERAARDAAQRKAERLAARLRELGVDPDALE